MKRKYLKTTQSGSRGQAIVEMAIVLPIFLLVVIGIFEVGRILYTIHGLDVSTRSGARAGVVQMSNADAINTAVITTRAILTTFNLDAGTAVVAAVVPVNGRDAVQVTANRVYNFLGTTYFPATLPLLSTATMRKEG